MLKKLNYFLKQRQSTTTKPQTDLNQDKTKFKKTAAAAAAAAAARKKRMSLQYPSLHEASQLRTKKHHPPTSTPPPPRTPAKTTTTTITPPPAAAWSSVAQGKKQSLREIEYEERARAQANDDERQNDMLLRAELLAQKRSGAFEEEKRKRKEEENALALKCKETHTPKQGFMSEWNLVFPEGNVWRAVPVKVNEKSVKFVQLWFTHWPDHMQARMVSELYQYFCAAFVPWVLQEHRSSEDGFLRWEQVTYPATVADNHVLRYEHMQEWAKRAEAEYKRSTPYERTSCGFRPPWVKPFWLEVTHTTWPNCLNAINKTSGTFEGGLCTIYGHSMNPNSLLEWNPEHRTAFGTYISARFQKKDVTPAQSAREKAARERRVKRCMEGNWSDDD